jgi:hypothetical protein
MHKESQQRWNDHPSSRGGARAQQRGRDGCDRALFKYCFTKKTQIFLGAPAPIVINLAPLLPSREMEHQCKR